MSAMVNNEIKQNYFEWMVQIALPNCHYNKLLSTLYQIEYIPTMEMDENRRKDGINFRYRYGLENGISSDIIDCYLNDFPCTMLEMMIALAYRIEETIMWDSDKGDRTSTWFVEMLNSLGIADQVDDCFNYSWVIYKIDIFNKRLYDSNGRGGLFTITDLTKDMREYDIWYQMVWFIDEYAAMEDQNGFYDNSYQNY